jgi:5,10-methylenetetrahydromethanopterin reductase
VDISCAFPPVPETPEHIALAERLGFRRAWVYDTPALQLDVWMTLARAAERTRTIELGPGVLIPSLRHVLVTAAAVATLVNMAPGRVNLGIGSGFTGRLAMGQRSNP